MPNPYKALLMTQSEVVPKLAQAMNRFAAELFKHLAEANDGNVFLSPSSIYEALAMLLAGARGETQAEISNALRYTQKEDNLQSDIHDAIQALRTSTRTGGIEFTQAMRL